MSTASPGACFQGSNLGPRPHPNSSVPTMPPPLMPERPLMVSPGLAATIGLEPALMLQALADKAQLSGQPRSQRAGPWRWLQLTETDLQVLFPFWPLAAIQRVAATLHQQGLLLIEADPQTPGCSWYAVDDAPASDNGTSPEPQLAPANPATSCKAQSAAANSAPSPGINEGKVSLPADWQPSEDWIKHCLHQGIPRSFVESLVPAFVSYWRDRGETRFSWGNAFCKHAIRQWREQQTQQGNTARAEPMTTDWRPSADAVAILCGADISQSFIEDAIPEFTLYWRERGTANTTWNSKFVEHVRRQWAKYSAIIRYDSPPQLIPRDWQPSPDCMACVQLAQIDAAYARSKVPEFVLYWDECKQPRASWNTVFLQFIKRDWARFLEQGGDLEEYHAQTGTADGARQYRIKKLLDELTDRSWAD